MNLYVQALTINKVRHLHDLVIELSPISETGVKHLILTGRNGCGKTSLLEALRDYLEGIPKDTLQYLNRWRGEARELESRIERIKSQLSITNVAGVRISVPDDNTLRDQMAKYIKNLNEIKVKLAEYENVDVRIPGLSEVVSRYNEGTFILAYFVAKRANAVAITNTFQAFDFQQRYNLTDSAADLFVQHLVNMKARRSFARDENNLVEATRIDEWFESFLKALRDLFDDSSLELLFDKENFNFKIQLGDRREPFDFNSMSDGYSSVMNIVSELVMRMEKKSSRVYDLPGIVLIDEIETHLHIELQKKILPFLTSFFPKVQFIVSSHSPFVLNSIRDAVVFDLENRIKVEDLSGYSADGIVKGYFQLDEYSRELKERIAKYRELAGKSALDDNEQEQFEDLDDYFSSLPMFMSPELQAEVRQIRIVRNERS